MGKKLAIGTISTILSVGVIGGICYQDIPAFKTSVNSFFEDMSNINISIDKSQDNSVNENEVRPITPEEFLKTYKFELPASFLGKQLYVKKLASNNLLVSSYSAEGILFCNVDTNETRFFELTFARGQYFCEMSNGNCYISSLDSTYSGLILYNAKDCTINKIYDLGYSYSVFAELANGEAMISSTSSNRLLLCKDDGAVVDYEYKFSKICPLPDNNCLVYQSSGGYGKFDTQTGTLTLIESEYTIPSTYIDVGNGNYLFYSISNTPSCAGLYCYVFESNGFIQLYSSGYYFNYVNKLPNGKYIFSSYTTSYFSGCLLFDPELIKVTELITTGVRYTFVSQSSDYYLILAPRNYQAYLLGIEDDSFNPLYTFAGEPKYNVLKNGSVLFHSLSSNSSSNAGGIWFFNVKDNTITNPYSSGWDFTIIEEMDNGNCLMAGTTATNISTKGLYLFDCKNLEGKILLNNVTVTSIVKQSDGTYLIETSDDFDYEYNPETDTIKLVYTVEQ